MFLLVLYALFVAPVKAGYMQLTNQVQGGYRQEIQVTERNRISPQPATTSVQGNQEDSDNLQPAMGYNAVTWTFREE